jgi:hypothetical protein
LKISFLDEPCDSVMPLGRTTITPTIEVTMSLSLLDYEKATLGRHLPYNEVAFLLGSQWFV